MNGTGNTSNDSVLLPAVVDLSQAGELVARLQRGLASGCEMTIDGSAVRRISSPCLEVLVAGMNAFAKADGPSMKIVNPSAAFLDTVTTLGLNDVLGLVGA
jgi:anti-anti-sigma regulatory factor